MIVNIVSASGGQGRSTLAALLTKKLAERGRGSVLLIDGCSDSRAQSLLAPESGTAYDLGDALCGRCCAGDAAFKAGGFSVMPSAADDTDLRADRMPDLLRELSAEYDHIIFDSPAGSYSFMAKTAEAADVTLLCCRAEEFYLSAAFRLRRRLPEREESCRLVLTGYSVREQRAGRLLGIDACIDKVGARLIGVLPKIDSREGKAEKAAADIAARLLGERVPLGRLS